MEVNKILTADVLDIIFDGRNKQYGAYDLRKTYNNRLRTSLFVMGGLVLALVAGYLISNYEGSGKKQVVQVQDVQLEDIKEEKKNEPPPPPPPPKPPPQVEMAKFTPPKIVKDEEVKKDERPPEVEKLEDTKIGAANQEGIKDDNLTAPPPDSKGVVEAPKDNTDYDKTFTKVEIESEYPGGIAAWYRYLSKNPVYPDEAVSAEVQGQVVVRFIVDKEGVVSDVEAVSGPNELRDAAVRVIKKSGSWNPAIQNGRKVKSYKSQPVNFKLEAQ